MSSVLICIGCNEYDHVKPLKSAERDAIDIFGGIREKSDLYDICHIFTSPTLQEVRTIFREILELQTEIEVLTITFSGHSGIQDRNLCLYLKDTTSEALSITSLSFSEILRFITELRPQGANIVLDSCNSAGMVTNLQQIMFSEALGQSQTGNINILAAAAADQYAGEDDLGGFLSQQAISTITGASEIRTDTEFLTLTDIATAAFRAFSKDRLQTPSYWCMNLTGPQRFCANPAYDGTGPVTRPIQFDAPVSQPVKHGIAELLYGNAEVVDVSRLAGIIWAARDELPTPAFFLLCESLAAAFIVRGKETSDPFHGLIGATVCASGLVLSKDEPPAADTLTRIVDTLTRTAGSALESAMDELFQHKFRMVDPDAGLLDFFFLPTRISKLLGWLGLVSLYNKNQQYIDKLKVYAEFIFDNYGNSIVCVSDEQSAPILIFLHACQMHGWIDMGEEVTSRMLRNYVEVDGAVAHTKLEIENVFEFLTHRIGPSRLSPNIMRIPEEKSFIQSAPELLIVLISGANIFNLEEFVEPLYHMLDRKMGNIFIPDSYLEFGLPRIERGTNISLQMGIDFWNTNDFVRIWTQAVEPKLPELDSSPLELLCCMTSLAFCDRVPWFLNRGELIFRPSSAQS